MSAMLVEPKVVDASRRRSAIGRLRGLEVLLPTWSELADPASIPASATGNLDRVDPDSPSRENLWRVHWFNDASRKRRAEVPGHLLLPPALTGVAAPIVVLLGRRFPMIGAHKVLAAYGCLVPRLVTGRFDPARDRAIWPSTGNYCRGGVAISRILGCRGVAVLPAGMSRERFDWLERWVSDPADIIRTPGSESNVKEIYDKCAELARDQDNIILNQFSEFANYLVHHHCTGVALARVFAHLERRNRDYRLAAFVCATGSAGTIAAGDHLKLEHGSKIVAVEALECPTMLCTGRRKIDPEILRQFEDIGLSGLANIVAAIKLVKHLDLGADDVVMTVATDGAALYASERQAHLARHYPDGFDEVSAGEIFARHLEGIVDDHVLELGHVERKRIFNLGYYTWVEQQGVGIDDFERRADQRFWRALADGIPAWDRLIREFNGEIDATRKY